MRFQQPHTLLNSLTSFAVSACPLKALPKGRHQSKVDHGGTFKDIAQRAWNSPEALLTESFHLLQFCGLLEPTDTLETLGDKYMAIEYPPEPSKVINTSILQYSFSDNSFRRGEGFLGLTCLCGTMALIPGL